MTAAERATDAALAGAADHRAATSDELWQADRGHEIPGWLAPEVDEEAPGNDCPTDSPNGRWLCTRVEGHPGRHFATSGRELYAAWPGTHEPTLADLDDPAPDDAGQPPALVLPDGWRISKSGTWAYVGPNDPGGSMTADVFGIDINGAYTVVNPVQARALATRLVEAAGIVEQIRAGAR